MEKRAGARFGKSGRTRLLNVATVAVLGYFALFVDFSGHGRMWDKLAGLRAGRGPGPGNGLSHPAEDVPRRIGE